MNANDTEASGDTVRRELELEPIHGVPVRITVEYPAEGRGPAGPALEEARPLSAYRDAPKSRVELYVPEELHRLVEGLAYERRYEIGAHGGAGAVFTALAEQMRVDPALRERVEAQLRRG